MDVASPTLGGLEMELAKFLNRAPPNNLAVIRQFICLYISITKLQVLRFLGGASVMKVAVRCG